MKRRGRGEMMSMVDGKGRDEMDDERMFETKEDKEEIQGKREITKRMYVCAHCKNGG